MLPTSKVFTRALLLSAVLVAAAAALIYLDNGDSVQAQVPELQDCESSQPASNQIPRCFLIEKQTDPDGSSQSFSFNVTVDAPNDPAINDPQSLQDGGTFGYCLGCQATPTGTVFTVTENVPGGWQLLSVDCDDAGLNVVPIANGIQATYTGGGEPADFLHCIFRNRLEPTPTPTATPTATPTRTSTPTSNTPTPTATSVIFDPPNAPGGLGGLFQPQPQPNRAPQPAPTTTAPTVRPPSTGDGGLN